MDHIRNIVKRVNPNFIPREEFAPGMMKHSAYTREAISNAIVDHMNRSEDEYTPIQRQGLARFQLEGHWNLSDPINMADLSKWFDIFNDVYFNGVLTNTCELEWADDRKQKLCSGEAWAALYWGLARIRA